ncbi:MAG: glycosyltransferase [Gammaproteobacteria bacterium]|nr:glycosyltransferase [Gammaproteobacteria bacterium]
MCVYKNDIPSFFREAYKTALNQTLVPTEFVLVVDGPIDSCLAVEIKHLQELCTKESITFNRIDFEVNKGHGEARKAGVLGCKCKYVAIFDADDIYDNTRLKQQYDYLEANPEISIVGSQIVEVDSKTLAPIGRRVLPVEHDDIMKTMKIKCPINQMTVMFIREAVLNVGNYQTFFHNEDYYLWIRLAIGGYRFHNLDKDLVRARVNPFFYRRRGGLEYFLSELRIQRFLLENNLIPLPLFIFNVFIRFFIQVLLPEKFRSTLFKLFFRKKVVCA